MMRSCGEAVALGGVGRFERADDDRFEGDFARVLGLGAPGVFVHQRRQQRLVERAPVDADAHRPVVFDGHLDHGAEVVVVLLADVDVARIDAVLGERAGALGIFLQQDVAVVVEVADDGHAHAELVERLDDLRHGCGGGFVVLTVTRTSSEPARASAITWLTVDETSAVSVLVIDWTTIG